MDIFSISEIANRFQTIRWTGTGLRSQCLPDLPATTLLHAGPPLEGAVPQAICNSACAAMVFEGLAVNHAQAQSMLQRAAVRLAPAQDYGVVTPLAQVVSASMPLARVQGSRSTRFAPLIEAGVPALRFGNAEADTAARLRMMGLFAAHVLAPALAQQPVNMAAVVLHALENHEECHALTGAANAALVQALALPAQDAAVLNTYPAFVLPIMMAACSVWLGESGATITAAAGNGQEFGWKRRGDVTWHTTPADAPNGLLLDSQQAEWALGAIGDSAVVDFAGLGGQALYFAPTLSQAYAAHLPSDLRAQRNAIIDPKTGNVCQMRIVGSDALPLVNLAIIGNTSSAGLIGRGVYTVPAAAFSA